MKLLEKTTQIYPIERKDNKDEYLIKNKKELIEQLRSLKFDVRINAVNLKETVFYRDYNALSCAIEFLEEMDIE